MKTTFYKGFVIQQTKKELKRIKSLKKAYN